jgi:hypothetical protein
MYYWDAHLKRFRSHSSVAPTLELNFLFSLSFQDAPVGYFSKQNGCSSFECFVLLSPNFNLSDSPEIMSVLQHFEEYQRSRVKFVQAVAEAATRPQNIEVMNNAGVMQLLRPLLLDNVLISISLHIVSFISSFSS